MAAQNPPSLVFVVARERGLWSLANAFVRPVRPVHDGDLVVQSIQRLDGHWGSVAKMYGERQITGKWLCMVDTETGDGSALAAANLRNLGSAAVDGIDSLVEHAVRVATSDLSAATGVAAAV